MFESYYKRVVALAKFKYEIEEDIVKQYEELIAACYVNGFTARRVADTMAEDIFK
jgi:hypothetical protein